MNLSLLHTFHNYNWQNLKKDLPAGLIIAAVSIPISMGYAQIAGLPAVYGLYGSVFPILLFALFSTSPQMIFGVDAAPAALVGSALMSFGIQGESEAAMTVVPLITLFTAIWLLFFHIIKAGNLVSYISNPVMGGFITGICTEIILMQIPKLAGGTAGTGELFELLSHIIDTLQQASLPSLLLGISALTILLVSKKLIPKFPMAAVLMLAGAVMTRFLPIREAGIHTLSAVEPGLPKWSLPHAASTVSVQEICIVSLSVALVIMSETLLAENSFAQKNGYRIDNNQELLAFSLGNLAASLTGCCPINGSVSRTAMSEQYQGKTQMTGLTAGLTMIFVLLFATGFIGYLPVPVLTAIVISALLGAAEFDIGIRLFKVNRKECLIFLGAFFGVLLLGTVNGVLIGIILSFAEMIIRSAKPSRCFLGIQPGHRHFRNMEDNDDICAIRDVVIYRFSSSLFFANIDILQRDIEESLKPETKAVILDASGITSLDITAADRLEMIYQDLKKRGIRFYMTEHIADVNDQLRRLGLGYMIEEGAVRRTIHISLKDFGYHRPYPLEGNTDNLPKADGLKRLHNQMQEYSWAFGTEEDQYIERQVHYRIGQMTPSTDLKRLLHGSWKYMEDSSKDEWLLHLKGHIPEIAAITGKNEKELLELLEENRQEIFRRLQENHPELVESFLTERSLKEEMIKEKYPEIFTYLKALRQEEDSPQKENLML